MVGGDVDAGAAETVEVGFGVVELGEVMVETSEVGEGCFVAVRSCRSVMNRAAIVTRARLMSAAAMLVP